jgi:DNA-binding transcriptional MerR regulator
MKFLMVSDAARVINRSAETIRNYERTGKLAAIKTSNGSRLFREEDVQDFARKLAAKSGEIRKKKGAVFLTTPERHGRGYACKL